ncbi:hypothetical protein Poly41_22950 [Novipirellula artificiosorum]|uniref:Uncharacterized protein n=1 Tax=Novipirellula artificiosorum TaxID=2528016 RepID=A0A5C6DVK2_9BACT|nr:hypothetical protein Poly41_22950 [Novipirellula artificiosorum]
MQDSVLPADQVKRVARLLGRAVLRWQRERDANAKNSEIISDSLPQRLESRPVSSLSVSGRNDRARSQEKLGGSVETGSRHETGDTGVVRRTTTANRGADRRSDPAACGKDRQPEIGSGRSEERQDGGCQ